MPELTLYHYWRSGASWRVRWALEIKKISHEKIAVKGEEKQEYYTRKNPSGYLPCLLLSGKPPLGESMAILEWLEENHPSHSFFAGDSFLRAKIRQLAETVNSGIQPLQNLDVIRKISSDKEMQAEWIKHWITRGLGVYENLLSTIERKGVKFSVADHPTIADFCLIPQCYSSLRFGVDLGLFPQCRAIYEHALTTPECKASAPEAFQP